MPNVLTDQQIANAAASAGFSPLAEPSIRTAVAVALAESRGDSTATHVNANGTTDYGLWQINSVHLQAGGILAGVTPADLLTAVGNASAAKRVYNAQKWSAWSTYKSGAYLLFMERARKVALTASGEGTVTDPETKTTGPLDSLGDLANNLSKPFEWLGTPRNWLRIGYVILGGVLVTAGAVAVLSNSNAVKNIGKAIP